MPSSQIWLGLFLLCLSPLGLAAQPTPTKPDPVQAPEQPSAALLEFIGDWTDDERLLIGMEKVDTSTRKPSPKEVRRAP